MSRGEPSDAGRLPPAHSCLAEPVLCGVAGLRAHLLDRIKRAAITQLHASSCGERLLLGMYHSGEVASLEILRGQLSHPTPGWLRQQIEQHLSEEETHAALFAAAIETMAPAPIAPAGLSQRKLRRWEGLARRHAPYFTNGALVPVFATALCAEQMALRIMERHCDTIGPGHRLHVLFSRVASDERRHVRLCSYTLQRLVKPTEGSQLAALLRELRATDAEFGVTGAVFMFLMGVLLRSLASVGLDWRSR